jgi:hypothetical protein
MDEDPCQYTPTFVYGSVLRLYKKELQRVKNDADSEVLKQYFANFKSIGYAKISLLALGNTPESLLGASSIR